MKQFVMTPAAGKRLIGKAMAVHPAVRAAMADGTVVIVAGTTNGYVAEELLSATGQAEGFSRVGFRRGMTVPPGGGDTPNAKLAGDVVLLRGQWQQGKTIFDVVDQLRAGDVIVKGCNAFDAAGQAAVYIGDPKGGTIGAAMQAVVGRRVRLILPVGLEKRVLDDVDDLARACNAPGAEGPRLLPVPGEIFTELDAIRVLTGASARLVAAGGVYGAEGAVWIAVDGDAAQIKAAETLLRSVQNEPPCRA